MNNLKKKSKTLTLDELKAELKLELLTNVTLDKIIDSSSVHRVGYEFAGYFDTEGDELTNSVHVIGKKEGGYIKTFCNKKQEEVLEQYFSYPFPCVILSEECEVPKLFLDIAEKHEKAVFKSNLKTIEILRNIKFFLQKTLAEEYILKNYIFMDVYGVGVLIGGYEEAKFGLTVELLERGHKFITDDNILIKKDFIDNLLGYNRLDKNLPDSHFFLSNDANIPIDVTMHFGIKSTRTDKRIDILINLEKWIDKKFYDRLGIDTVYENILGVNIPKFTLPVKKGRNLAVIVEAGAMNNRLKKMGINSAEYFWKESMKIIESKKTRKDTMDTENKKVLKVETIVNKFDLEILNGHEYLVENLIGTTNIHRPSLALSGYFDMYEEDGYNGIQIFSELEFNFLEKLDPVTKEINLEKYLNYNFPMIIITKDTIVPEYFYDHLKDKKTVVCRSNHPKVSQIMAVYNSYLETYFSQNVSMHGVFLELYGFGVLLVGKSGIGKSETALELIHRGHRLIADDMVKFVKDSNEDIVGKAAKLPYFMEIRGLGIIDIKALYGLGAVRISKKLDAIIELRDPNSENYSTSVSYEKTTMDIIGKPFDKAILYISSGRNAAAMVEIAVMNIMAKRLGHDSERCYKEGINRLTPEERDLLDFAKIKL
ncbi:MAG: HPr(Ser) kinase/phosphatase [Fusobacteriaceae bacterium]